MTQPDQPTTTSDMQNQNTSCSIHPYFKIPEGKLDAFKAICERFMEKIQNEPGCLNYGFSFEGDRAFCRESYENAEALLFHAENVAAEFEDALALVELTRLEIHGPAEELAKLREPFAGLNAEFYVIEYDYRRA